MSEHRSRQDPAQRPESPVPVETRDRTPWSGGGVRSRPGAAPPPLRIALGKSRVGVLLFVLGGFLRESLLRHRVLQPLHPGIAFAEAAGPLQVLCETCLPAPRRPGTADRPRPSGRQCGNSPPRGPGFPTQHAIASPSAPCPAPCMRADRRRRTAGGLGLLPGRRRPRRWPAWGGNEGRGGRRSECRLPAAEGDALQLRPDRLPRFRGELAHVEQVDPQTPRR